MKFKGDIIVTDPCYIVKKHADLDKLISEGFIDSIRHCIIESTLYGDWSCTTYKTDKDPISVINQPGLISDSIILGEFCADAGLVGVFYLDEVIKYNPAFKDKIKKNPHIATILYDFNGCISYQTGPYQNAHIIGIGNYNFYTLQTGF